MTQLSLTKVSSVHRAFSASCTRLCDSEDSEVQLAGMTNGLSQAGRDWVRKKKMSHKSGNMFGLGVRQSAQ